MGRCPRCSDALPVPLQAARIVRTWECTPQPERWISIFLSSFVGTPVTTVPEQTVKDGLALAGLSIPEVRLKAYKGNYQVQTVTVGGVLSWRINRAFMTNVRDARLLGCCQQDAPLCYQVTFPDCLTTAP